MWPEPGAAVTHVEFTHDGRYVLVSIRQDAGAVIVYHAVTLEKVTRLPMRKPLGTDIADTKITFPDGTRHEHRRNHCKPWPAFGPGPCRGGAGRFCR
ncbi:cytochrome D1 domain-containing protein [Roseovarius sp. MS2]|uniref:cytochrome D1 domain-containing protein n=1 Tax=Roseovarius sp. MS2 TaxID=3390728 RepID=UPI003EDC9E2D